MEKGGTGMTEDERRRRIQYYSHMALDAEAALASMEDFPLGIREREYRDRLSCAEHALRRLSAPKDRP